MALSRLRASPCMTACRLLIPTRLWPAYWASRTADCASGRELRWSFCSCASAQAENVDRNCHTGPAPSPPGARCTVHDIVTFAIPSNNKRVMLNIAPVQESCLQLSAGFTIKYVEKLPSKSQLLRMLNNAKSPHLDAFILDPIPTRPRSNVNAWLDPLEQMNA